MKQHLKTIALLSFIFSSAVYAQSYFPEIQNWKLSEDIKVYNSETLWEYINGAADYYNAYGFEKMELAEYSKSDDIYIKAEVYYHNSSLNAFGIYSYERGTDLDYIDIGAEGYVVYSTLNFYNNKCYVKISSYNEDEETIEAIHKIANAVDAYLGSSPTKPIELQQLPEKNKVTYTEKFVTRNFLGYSFFANVLTATYITNEISADAFFIPCNSNDAAFNILQQYLATQKLEFKNQEGSIYEIDDLFNDKVYLLVQNQKLYGVYNCSDTAIAKTTIGYFLAE